MDTGAYICVAVSVAAVGLTPALLSSKWFESITLNGQEVKLMNGHEPDATKATDEAATWTDEELAAATEITTDDVKFALGSSTDAMRELLRTQPNNNGDS